MYKFFVKRVLDFFVALFALVLLSPLLLVTSIVLVFANKGSVFFTQMRPGKNEKLFKILKFKTMNDRRNALGEYLPDAQRLTAVGKIIRKTSLDELPQLFNVIKGDMSLIGPRPLLSVYLPYYTTEEKLRHTVKPGITGWAQVNGRNNSKWQDRLEADVYYVENLSFKLDISILLRTIRNVISGKDIIVIPNSKMLPLHMERSNANVGLKQTSINRSI